MCGLFGFTDTQNRLTQRQVNRLTYALAVSSEQRGTDACGVAYNYNGGQHIYKRPVRAKRMRFNIPAGVHTVIGHTRLTTQGSEKQNYNNHPFSGLAGCTRFTLAHNGVLQNDTVLREEKHLPETKIQTDSYVAVQLLEQHTDISHKSLQAIAECLIGTFTLSVLNDHNNLFLVKGNNPLSLVHFADIGLYVYASTEDILLRALRHTGFLNLPYTKLALQIGDILEIDSSGELGESRFNTSLIDAPFYRSGWGYRWGSYDYLMDDTLGLYDDLLSVAGCMGYSAEDIHYLLESGFTEEDIEEMLYEIVPATPPR